MIIEILRIAAQIENDAPNQLAALQIVVVEPSPCTELTAGLASATT